jgi:prephenate dehydrogenase
METPAAGDFRSWLERIGARIVVTDCETHDRLVSWTSHLPQLAATALAATVGEEGGRSAAPLAGPGLAGATRLALSSYELWRDILATNAENIERALAAYIQELEHIRENLRTRLLQEEFERAARFAGSLPRGRNSDAAF